MMLCSSQCIISRVTYPGHHIHEPCNMRDVNFCHLVWCWLGFSIVELIDKYVVLT